MSDWSEELKQKVIEMYQEQEPTPENSVEIVQSIAEEVGKTSNGVRMVLSKAGVYVKKDVVANAKKATKEGAKRVSKSNSIDTLKEVLNEKGLEVNDEILEKLTGKAAVYFASVISSIK